MTTVGAADYPCSAPHETLNFPLDDSTRPEHSGSQFAFFNEEPYDRPRDGPVAVLPLIAAHTAITAAVATSSRGVFVTMASRMSRSASFLTADRLGIWSARAAAAPSATPTSKSATCWRDARRPRSCSHLNHSRRRRPSASTTPAPLLRASLTSTVVDCGTVLQIGCFHECFAPPTPSGRAHLR